MNEQISNFTCQIQECNYVDDIAFACQYIYLASTIAFVLLVLYSSTKYKARLEYALKVASAAAVVKTVDANLECTVVRGCRFLVYHDKTRLTLTALTVIFQFMVFTIILARFFAVRK